MKKEKKQFDKFEGFPPDQQTWDFPNIINGFVHRLSGAEFKVLWYILRHTYGWQKDSDRISLTQFERGIFSKKKNQWLDRGTGLSRQGIITALKGLEKKGFIKKTIGKINTYEVVKKLDYPSQKSRPIGSQENRHTIPNNTIFNKQEAPIKDSEIYKDLAGWFDHIGKSPTLAMGLIKKYGQEKVKRAYKNTCYSGGTIETFFYELKSYE